jgi:hypothetical protein
VKGYYRLILVFSLHLPEPDQRLIATREQQITACSSGDSWKFKSLTDMPRGGNKNSAKVINTPQKYCVHPQQYFFAV